MEELVDEIIVDMEQKLKKYDIELDISDTDEIRDLLDAILENYEG